MQDFITQHLPPLTLTMRADVAAWLPAVFAGAPTNWYGEDVRRLRGGRGEVVTLVAGGAEVIVRPYRRGGLPGKLLTDIYCGCRPRPQTELRVTETLRGRGAPVVEAFGAAVQWLAPACYRGWLATRLVTEARSFWRWAQERPSDTDRSTILRATGEAIRALYDCGGYHPDLNLNNVLVRTNSDAHPVTLIDFDRARVDHAASGLEAMLRRFRRSARKLDPTGHFLSDADLEAVALAAQAGGTSLHTA